MQSAPQALDTTFQYPLRVEVGCNRLRFCVRSLRSRRFSTLYGSKWVATCANSAERTAVILGFSTLYGSKWVATLRAVANALVSTCFSTLYGSKWVATRVDPSGSVFVDWFQYPLRVEVGCNTGCSACLDYVRRVSVPSTGRSGLQQQHLFVV